MIVAGDYPANLCPGCGGELRRAVKRQGWICKDCGEFWPDDMLDAEIQCPEKPGTMR